MTVSPAICLFVLSLAGLVCAEDELLDRLDDALTFSTLHEDLRFRLSGTIDLEEYGFQQPPPGLIRSRDDTLFNPRLSLFLDSQFGSHVYFFAQSRVDRGFDPSEGNGQIRLDEYALRITPWEDGRLNLQIGKFATVVGNFVQRHLSWDNPFVTAPLAYEQVARIPYTQASSLASLRGAQYIPIIWGPDYTTGFSLTGNTGAFQYAAEIKNASLSAEPSAWNPANQGFAHPTVSGRAAWHLDESWTLGLSASEGPYLDSYASPLLPQGYGLGSYREYLLGQDISFAWHHWQLWAECYETRFQVPGSSDNDSVTYYLEAKYKFLPQLFGALRWNQQIFTSLPHNPVNTDFMGTDIWSVDTALAYRFTARTQLKIQFTVQHDNHGPREFGELVAAQFTIRF